MAAITELRKGRNPFADHGDEHRAGVLGMWLFLASLGALFIATMIGLIVVRLQHADWSMPALPWMLGVSTLIIIASDVCMHRALHAAKAGRGEALNRFLFITALLCGAFMLSQVIAWAMWLPNITDGWEMAGAEAETQSVKRLALSGLYILTGLHALHVIGGAIPLSIILRRARAGRYAARKVNGVTLCAMYWHFLTGTWCTLLLVLLGLSM
jgi:cytochrome c oxidase subunit 3